MAHLFCELYLRLQIVELAPDGTYDLPISQEELGEMIGVTPVHANRTLQQLRKQEVIEFAGGTVTIKDFEGLKRTAEFDPAYLYLERCPSR
jgi:CRP-like cAMP-binding protein